MRILVCSWGNICETPLELTLRDMGHDIVVLKEKIRNKDYDDDYLKLLSGKLLDDRYDCVFSINYIPIISRVCNVCQIKYISWTVDSPWFQFHSDTITNNCNFIFIFDRCLYEKYKDKFPDRIFYMPLGTNVRWWDSIDLSEEDRNRFSSDVSFVGSLYEDKHDYDNVDLPTYLRGYFDGIMEAQMNVYGYNFLNDVITDDAIEEFSKCADWNSIGNDYTVSNREIVISEFIGKKCAEIERFKFVDKIAKNFNFDLYTLSNTDSIPYVNNRGPADSKIDMPKIFKCSKININMTIKTIESGIPLRIYDIMGNGGFVITNYQSELYDYFIPGEDLVVYESLEDLINKISYYLSHEDERKKIADAGYQKVKSLYTYEKRLQDIFQIVWQDSSKAYGTNSINSQNKCMSLINLFSQLNISKILDVGMFINSQSKIISSIKFDYKNIMDGFELISNNDLKNQETIYNNVYNLSNLPIDFYDLIIIIEIVRYLKDDEIVCLIKQFEKITRTIIIDYRENYYGKLNDCKEYNLQKLQLSDCELLLISIN